MRAHPITAVRGSTIVEVFRNTVGARFDAVALREHDGRDWQSTTWGAYEQDVTDVALGLRAAGLEPGDRVGILSGNRAAWHIVDLGILTAGLVSTPVYATASSSQVAHVLRDAACRACVVEDSQQLAKVLLRRHELPDLELVVTVEGVEGVDDAFVRRLDDLRADGAAARRPGALDEMVAAVRPEQLATLVYTSGTTGPPKGVMLSHANLMATLRSLASFVGLSPDERFLSFLPLSHITERSVSHFGQIASGGETWFAGSLAMVPDDLRACRPTLFFAVPRVWEKFRDAIVEAAGAAPPPVRALVDGYLELADRRTGVQPLARADEVRYRVLDATIGHLLRRRLGLDRARILACGAAPVHADLIRWFHGIGLPVAEGYGQTEVSLCTTMNPPADIRIGTVGRPIPGVEVRIAPDGEVLVRGGGVCQGYWARPDATAELIDGDGWLRTGDLGALDDDGYLRITGRKKDLIITAYGKNISPALLETALQEEPLIAHAVVVGDDRPYLVALLALDLAAAETWAARHGRHLDPDAPDEDDQLRAAVDAAVERVNTEHSHAEAIRHWRLLPRELTVGSGDLTPTLKVRREALASEFTELVDEMYAQPVSV